MNWFEELKNFLIKFFDKPIVITIVGITYLLIVALIIFSKTSLGQKAIKKFALLFTRIEEISNETKEKVEKVEELANERIEALKAFYDQKVTALVSIVDYYETTLFETLEQIPNVKVQSKVKELKDGYLKKKEEINQWVTLTYQDQQKQVEELVKKVEEEKDRKIARLTNEFEKLKELVKPLLNESEEVENGEEREKGENTEGTQEIL